MGVSRVKLRYLMLFCHFDEKNLKKHHSKLLKKFFCFFIMPLIFNVTGTRTTVGVTNLFEKAEYKQPIFRALYLRFFWYRNKGPSVLYSPWASGHLYTYRNNWITVSILQYRVTFWTPEIVPRLNKLSKWIGSFCIRCGLGWVLGGYAGTISS